MRQEATEAVIAGYAQKVGVGGGLTALVGGLSANELAAIGGLVIAVIGLLVQVYFKRKDDRRRQLLHDTQMRHYSDKP